MGGGGGVAGARASSGAKGGNKTAKKAAVQAAKLADAREKKRDAADAARAAAIAPPPQLMLDAPPPWLTRSGLPAPNAAQDEFTALHLLWHNTGMGTQRALFELHHCDNTPAQREALIAKVKLDMEVVTAEMKAAQPGVAQRYREHNNDQQRLYVCACCGERNKEDTGECTWVSVAALCGSALTLPPLVPVGCGWGRGGQLGKTAQPIIQRQKCNKGGRRLPIGVCRGIFRGVS